MTDQKYPPSYSQRLSDFIGDSKKETLTVPEVHQLIRDFCALEYKKIKEKSDVIPFGKYRGRSVKVLCSFDRQYVKWLLDKQKLDNYPVIKRDVHKYLKEIDDESKNE
tara:strand:+ start:139 stop:462 length:324 start_codon:yes stop_codon:yes gene_type:complete